MKIVRRKVRVRAAAFAAALAGCLCAAQGEPAAPGVRDGAIRIALVQPLDYEVVQRTGLASGTIPVEGYWTVPRHAAPPDRLETRLVAPGRGPAPDEGWKPLPFDPRSRGFRCPLPAAPGGWYTLQVRAWRDGAEKSLVTVAHVGVGEVFVIAGQSNSANYGEVRTKPKSGLVTAFDGHGWAPADDPQPGATGTKGSFIPSFGDALVAKLGVPVGVICVGVGSTSVREWMPRDTAMSTPPTTGAHVLTLCDGKFVSSGELFEKLTGAIESQGPHGIRAVLWHQGESDWRQPPGHEIAIEEYRRDLGNLIGASRRAAGWGVPWFVAQASYGSPASPGSPAFRAAQRSVADDKLTFVGPNTDTLGPHYRSLNGRGVHFTEAGLKRHGQMWADILAPWILSGQ